VRMAENIKKIFLYESIPVQDRFLSTDEIVFDNENSTLLAYFELTFMQETGIQEKTYPKMKTLNTEVKQNNGTSTNNNPV
jgi:hypothetical protein